MKNPFEPRLWNCTKQNQKTAREWYPQSVHLEFKSLDEFHNLVIDPEKSGAQIVGFNVQAKGADRYLVDAFVVQYGAGIFYPITIDDLSSNEVEELRIILMKHWKSLEQKWCPIADNVKEMER